MWRQLLLDAPRGDLHLATSKSEPQMQLLFKSNNILSDRICLIELPCRTMLSFANRGLSEDGGRMTSWLVVG